MIRPPPDGSPSEHGEGPIGSSLRLWMETIGDIDDQTKVFELGKWSYRAFYGEEVSSHKENLEFLRILAALLDRAFRTLGPEDLKDLKECLEGRGRFFETPFWEHPIFRGQAHYLLEKEASAGRMPTLLELLLTAHELEASIRPNLLRMLWIARRSTDDRSKKYSDLQLNPTGRQGSLGHAVSGLSKWLVSKSRHVLSQPEADEFRSFLKSLSGGDPDQISAEELRNWPAHRDFMIGKKTVVMNFHPHPGRRMLTDREGVTLWRRQTLGLMALLHGFKVMFLVHAGARCGDIRPAFLPE